MGTSQTALHVLRLVLRNVAVQSSGTARRNFSVAASPTFTRASGPSSSTSTVPSNAWDPRHASSDYEGSSDFLEDARESEYASAALTLPERVPGDTAHWATLFAQPEKRARTNQRPAVSARRCEVLARLVSSGDLVTARSVYNELSALHIGIMPRSLYLSAALSSLDQTPSGKSAFLFWLELVPNRPAVRVHPKLQAPWQPVIDRLINDFSTDKGFILDFLRLTARKGVLPSVCGALIRHLALSTTPAELEVIMHELAGTYMASTTSSHSTSARAAAHLAVAQRRVQDMWNSYARGLAAAGWEKEVKQLVMAERVGGMITKRTLGYVEGRLPGFMAEVGRGHIVKVARELKTAQQSKNAPAHGAPIPAALTLPVGSNPAGDIASVPIQDPPVSSAGNSIVYRTRLARFGLVKPTELTNLLILFEQNGRTGLVQRLASRLERSHTNSHRELWNHAAMLWARKKGLGHAVLIDIFERNFLWIGIPREHSVKPSATTRDGEIPQPLARREGTEESAIAPARGIIESLITTSQQSTPQRPKIYPSPSLLATVIPSLLALLPTPLNASISAFHTEYFAGLSELSPRLRPTAVTHSVFLRTITHLLGPHAGLGALRQMVQHGVRPTLADYNAVVWSMAGTAQWKDLKRMLSGMERGLSIDHMASLDKQGVDSDIASAQLNRTALAAVFGSTMTSEGSALSATPEIDASIGTMPRPDIRTYKGVVGILSRAGLDKEAETIRARMWNLEWAASTAWDSSNVTAASVELGKTASAEPESIQDTREASDREQYLWVQRKLATSAKSLAATRRGKQRHQSTAAEPSVQRAEQAVRSAHSESRSLPANKDMKGAEGEDVQFVGGEEHTKEHRVFSYA